MRQAATTLTVQTRGQRLVEITREDDLKQALSALAADWEGRIEIRLLGPQAPFDFTPTPLPPR